MTYVGILHNYYSRLALCMYKKLNIVYICLVYTLHRLIWTTTFVSLYVSKSNLLTVGYTVTIVSVRSIDLSYKSRTYMHRRCFLFFNVSFHILNLINTLVVQVDLQRFCPEFRAFHSIMQQMLATKTTFYDPSWHTH